MKQFYISSLTLVLILIYITSFGQKNQGGLPYSFENPDFVKSEVMFESMPEVDVMQLLAEDEINDQYKDIPWRFGENLYVEYNLKNSGEWEDLPKGDRLWRLGIKCPGAYTINLTFDNYYLPPGAKLFVYNTEKSHIIGAFTEDNNQEDRAFATTLVMGDELVIEYYEPHYAEFSGELNLWRVTHGYRDAYGYAEAFGSSGSCNNNVVCPEAAGWEDEIRSACMLVSGGSGFCSGAMINNVNDDGTPYLLTADHCYSNPSSWVFWFNWESPTCSNPGSSPPYDALSGAVLRARNSSSDFCLVELNDRPQDNSIDVFYAGWNRQNAASSSSVGIHHPSGDIKKISFDYDPSVSSDYDPSPYLPNSHWEITAWNDGTTEGGSSGSPLFDQNHRITGQLHGGWASCTSITEDFYGKFSMSWNYGGSSSNQLVNWLDPSGISGNTLNGYDPTTPTALTANFSGTPTTVVAGNTVTFTDLSGGPLPITSYSWSFPGGTPSSASTAGPHTITYNTVGTYDVSLTVGDGVDTDTETKTNYINVTNCTYCASTYSNTSDDWISNVTFNTINNNSGQGGSDSYEDFTSISTDIDLGSTYSISVSMEMNGDWTEHVWVWIDWNQDCDFDDSGEAFDLGDQTNTGTVTGSILVPISATPGVTTMRIIEQYNQDPTPCNTHPTTYGETEDYSVNVVAGALPGEDCSNAQDLSLLTSPYSATTTGYNNDFSFCVMGSSPDRIFFIDVPDEYTIEIWQSWNNYDSRHTMRYSGTCPGTVEIGCIDDDDYTPITWTNTTGSTERVWFIVAGYSANFGDFTLEWTLTPPASPPCIGDIDIDGAGTATWNYPLSTYYHDARTTSIYLASEFGCSGGTISAMRYYVSTTPGQTMNAFTIRMKHTSSGSYSAGNFETTGWTTVYQANETIGTTGWYTFNFTTPFIYNGTDNLEVDVCFNNTSYTTDGYVYYFNGGASRSKYYRCDGCSFPTTDPLTWTNTGTLTTNVPRAIFAFTATGTPGLWTGATSTDWATISNWDDGNIPDASIDVVIPSGLTNYPVVDETAVCNNLAVNDGGILTMSSGGNLSIGGDLTVGAGTSGEFQMDDGTCTVTGNYYTEIGSVTDVNGGTFNFTSWVRNASSVWSKGVRELSGGIINAAGDVIWSSFDVSGEMTGSFIVNIGGTLRADGSVFTTITGGTFVMNGSDNPGGFMGVVCGAWETGNYLSVYNLTFDDGGSGNTFSFAYDDAAMRAGIQIVNDFNVISGNVITAYGSGYAENFTVWGDFMIGTGSTVTTDVNTPVSVTGNLVVKSDAGADGSLLDNGTFTVTGSVNVERYTITDRWHTFSPSVSGETADIFHFGASTGFDVWLMEHDEATDSYTYIWDETTDLNTLEGYFVWGGGAAATPPVTEWTYQMYGGLNSGSLGSSNNLSRTYPGDGSGWNFVGNPYPSAIDWGLGGAPAGWDRTGLDATYYIWDGVQWLTYNYNTGAGFGSRYLAMGQGFYVNVSAVGTGTLILDNGVRVHNGTPYLKSEITNKVSLQVEGAKYTDETTILFREDATIGFDSEFDAYKLQSLEENAPMFYSVSTENLAVNVLPAADWIQLGFHAGVYGEYTISATEINDIPTVLLEDTFTGVITDLSSDSYTFVYSTNDNANRFIVHFSPLSTPENLADQFNIYSYEKNVYVSVPENTSGHILIYDMIGQEVAEVPINSSLNVIRLEKSAYYFVKVKSQQEIITEKVLIK